MEKVIEISGKETKFKASATTTIRYRKMFGHDLIQDLNKIRGTKEQTMTADVLEIFANFAYVMAKQADESIPDDVWEWLDSYEVFPYETVYPQIMELWAKSLGTTVEIKKA